MHLSLATVLCHIKWITVINMSCNSILLSSPSFSSFFFLTFCNEQVKNDGKYNRQKWILSKFKKQKDACWK